MKRQISDAEKQQVRLQQQDKDGSLRCFISGEVIGDTDDFEYDHILPFSKQGDSDLSNIRIVLKEYNRRKSDQPLYEFRDNYKLEKLFNDKKNNIKLQDIFLLKEILPKSFHFTIEPNNIKIDDGVDKRTFSLLFDNILNVQYFYGRIPIKWLENDDQEGLQPRVIDYKRLISLRDHLKDHPQLAPSIARLIDNRIKLFDGQHKLAGQVLNNTREVDIKAYISPTEADKAKKLFDDLMITNLDAHSKHKQIPFYTSTLLDRLSVIYKEMLGEFTSTKPVDKHSEENFISYLVSDKQHSRADAKQMLKSAIMTNAVELSAINNFTAVASRDTGFALSIDLLKTAVFPNTLFLEPSSANFKSSGDFRDSELENFKEVSVLLVQYGQLNNWVQNTRGKSLTNIELKARRIWHKGAVLTWAPYLKSILGMAFNFITNDDREKLLYRAVMDTNQKDRIGVCLQRLFNHPLWDEPEGEIDSLLVSARRQDELFNRKGLTEMYVLTGRN
ncbi:HNH endonuclease [Daejeonella rubra]|uniref:HNH endonuclease n=1 Tax=Daejeonella rubra TaxID=990371 RepID=A0A1G9T0I3_9SPHI|nr:HNH endonuclease domain-containing protein [Daejeonella rubra]SDM41138.1 HNH endonuclease [Daejeonella rubra]